MHDNDLSDAFVGALKNGFSSLGAGGKVVIALIVLAIVGPWILRFISFFRKGGDGV